MADKSPVISVIIPTGNRAHVLVRALRAYAGQEVSQDEFEIIVVDDGSTDTTARDVSSVAEDQPNIRYLRQEKGGPAKARNLGIANARGELLLITGDDCIPTPSLLGEHLRSHEGKRAIAVLGHVDWHPGLSITPFMDYVGRTYQFTYSHIRSRRRSLPFGFLYTSNISLPGSLLRDGFLFDEEFSYAAWEDVELGYRLWKSGVRIEYNPKAVTFHCHEVDLESYIQRQIRSGLAAARYFLKHPEAEELLNIQELVDPQSRIAFYESALKYYYLCGLQMGLSAIKPDDSRFAAPLEDRLERWSSEVSRRLFQKYQTAREESTTLRAILGEHDWSMKKLQEELEKCRKALEEERAALKKIRSSIPHKLFRLVRRAISWGNE